MYIFFRKRGNAVVLYICLIQVLCTITITHYHRKTRAHKQKKFEKKIKVCVRFCYIHERNVNNKDSDFVHIIWNHMYWNIHLF